MSANACQSNMNIKFTANCKLLTDFQKVIAAGITVPKSHAAVYES